MRCTAPQRQRIAERPPATLSRKASARRCLVKKLSTFRDHPTQLLRSHGRPGEHRIVSMYKGRSANWDPESMAVDWDWPTRADRDWARRVIGTFSIFRVVAGATGERNKERGGDVVHRADEEDMLAIKGGRGEEGSE